MQLHAGSTEFKFPPVKIYEADTFIPLSNQVKFIYIAKYCQAYVTEIYSKE